MNTSRNSVLLPAGACDCHAHVFGPFEQFPLAPTLTYKPPQSTLEDFVPLLKRLGFQRAVLVQGSAHGQDNGAMLSALQQSAEHPNGIDMRGIAVTDSSVSDKELVRWYEHGVRGLRFRHAPSTGSITRYHNTVGLDQFLLLAPRMREIGLHAQLWTHASLWEDIEESVLKTGVPIVIDHMARIDPVQDMASPAFHKLMKALENGKIWVKMTAYRNTNDFPDMNDMIEATQTFLARGSSNLIWGSDWPHINFQEKVDTERLLTSFLGQLDCPEAVQQILVDNPARLYGF